MSAPAAEPSQASTDADRESGTRSSVEPKPGNELADVMSDVAAYGTAVTIRRA